MRNKIRQIEAIERKNVVGRMDTKDEEHLILN